MGTPYWRRWGILQGCPFSMTLVALIMRPWIIIMRSIPGVQCLILADDVLILATGKGMVRNVADAINKTHQCLHAMGAKVVELAKALEDERAKKEPKEPKLVDAIRKGQMRDVAPKKFVSTQASGNFRAWAKDMTDYIYWHDSKSKELIEYLKELRRQIPVEKILALRYYRPFSSEGELQSQNEFVQTTFLNNLKQL